MFRHHCRAKAQADQRVLAEVPTPPQIHGGEAETALRRKLAIAQNECDARNANTKFGASGVSPAASWPLSVQPEGSA
jgi:hypothetical protein